MSMLAHTILTCEYVANACARPDIAACTLLMVLLASFSGASKSATNASERRLDSAPMPVA